MSLSCLLQKYGRQVSELLLAGLTHARHGLLELRQRVAHVSAELKEFVSCCCELDCSDFVFCLRCL